MTKKSQDVRILDADGVEVACLTSADPEFSFNQYIRNRDAAGWSYRLGAAGEARQEDQPAPIDA